MEARLLQDLADKAAASELRLRMELGELSKEILERLGEVLEEAPGECRVIFELRRPDGCVATLQAQQRVSASPELAEAIRQACGDAVAVVEE
jgi:hypothetical protein